MPDRITIADLQRLVQVIRHNLPNQDDKARAPTWPHRYGERETFSRLLLEDWPQPDYFLPTKNRSAFIELTSALRSINSLLRETDKSEALEFRVLFQELLDTPFYVGVRVSFAVGTPAGLWLDFYRIDETLLRDLHRAAINLNISGQADKKPDKKKKKSVSVPNNPRVTKLAKLIKQKADKNISKIEIARDFCEGNEAQANSLLRELRRFPHLLEADK